MTFLFAYMLIEILQTGTSSTNERMDFTRILFRIYDSWGLQLFLGSEQYCRTHSKLFRDDEGFEPFDRHRDMEYTKACLKEGE
jgi:hypothetical protein